MDIGLKAPNENRGRQACGLISQIERLKQTIRFIRNYFYLKRANS
ncbi:hypothetical protein FIU95_15130 [Microbulbifer sp. THAF38]|nr:hypothetical protein FIU95_15130 [Microbulbifer sp. THAF38]